jgi:hypothetical protein
LQTASWALQVLLQSGNQLDAVSAVGNDQQCSERAKYSASLPGESSSAIWMRQILAHRDVIDVR